MKANYRRSTKRAWRAIAKATPGFFLFVKPGRAGAPVLMLSDEEPFDRSSMRPAGVTAVSDAKLFWGRVVTDASSHRLLFQLDHRSKCRSPTVLRNALRDYAKHEDTEDWPRFAALIRNARCRRMDRAAQTRADDDAADELVEALEEGRRVPLTGSRFKLAVKALAYRLRSSDDPEERLAVERQLADLVDQVLASGKEEARTVLLRHIGGPIAKAALDAALADEEIPDEVVNAVALQLVPLFRGADLDASDIARAIEPLAQKGELTELGSLVKACLKDQRIRSAYITKLIRDTSAVLDRFGVAPELRPKAVLILSACRSVVDDDKLVTLGQVFHRLRQMRSFEPTLERLFLKLADAEGPLRDLEDRLEDRLHEAGEILQKLPGTPFQHRAEQLYTRLVDNVLADPTVVPLPIRRLLAQGKSYTGTYEGGVDVQLSRARAVMFEDWLAPELEAARREGRDVLLDAVVEMLKDTGRGPQAWRPEASAVASSYMPRIQEYLKALLRHTE